ncbi:MAG TPA: hypothetical protein VH540_05785 [Ktedonobacterales bacterium]|jgi:hypothetical protein
MTTSTTTLSPAAPGLTLYDLLVAVLTIGVDTPDLAPPDLSHLADLKLERLTIPGPAAQLIAFILPKYLTHAQKRRAQKKRANGGRRARRGGRLDLAPPQVDAEWLQNATTGAVHAELYARLEQAMRLAVLAQRSAVRGSDSLREQHRALASVLLVVQMCCERLCEPAGEWFMLVCLKDALLDLWVRLFRQIIPLPLFEHLRYSFTKEQGQQACDFLLPEARQGARVPPPFFAVVMERASQEGALARQRAREQAKASR